MDIRKEEISKFKKEKINKILRIEIYFLRNPI